MDAESVSPQIIRTIATTHPTIQTPMSTVVKDQSRSVISLSIAEVVDGTEDVSTVSAFDASIVVAV
ncbi:hypothetical protein CEE69_15755 [Rhodopirellula bahusiensis]|uniref:Uncharacterized protein n=1 Tax=Rhodopirellula bahusiensis TaxID=2014065 RepID=A0A2G1W5Z3_9BACT|nr:hypothetical protein CEE69_15755 [Rhodopirellula bahusiensis]